MSFKVWKGMEIGAIPQFIRTGTYQVNVDLERVPAMLGQYVVNYNLDMDPPFQRAHVWTVEQKSRYMEFFLRGGRSGRVIYFNCFNWSTCRGEPLMSLVDGKQRIDAICEFLEDRVEVFGGMKRSDFTGRARSYQDLLFNVNDLKSWAEVYQWYLDLNNGGTVHTPRELDKVRKLLVEAGDLPPQFRDPELTRDQLLSPRRLCRLIREAALEEVKEEEEMAKLRERHDAEMAKQPPVKARKRRKLG